ncbi:MAG: carbohydrate porin [Phycisphaeraceae bacterium]|nr:carbohydrate porin [Phycisphaeraceae bacterium]
MGNDGGDGLGPGLEAHAPIGGCLHGGTAVIVLAGFLGAGINAAALGAAQPTADGTAIKEAAPAIEQRDWFGEGGRPWWAWQQATGDWGGARTWLEDAGVTVEGSYTLDWFSIWKGGLDKTAGSYGLLQVDATLDFEKLLGISGGSFFVDVQSNDVPETPDPSGAFQTISWLAAPEHVTEVDEAWYEQRLFEDGLRLKIGKIDANTEFDLMPATANFLNLSSSISPTAFGMPTYPNPAMGFVFFVHPSEHSYISGGIFDGSGAEGVETGAIGFSSLFRADEFYAVGQGGLSWERVGELGAGHMSLGGWYQSGDFVETDGSDVNGVAGMYFLGQQQVLRRPGAAETDDQGLYVFAQAGWASAAVTNTNWQAGGGLLLNGTFPGRDDDSAGLYFSWTQLDGGAPDGGNADETVMELYYRISITPWLTVQPDLQVIWSPINAPDVDSTVAGLLRIEVVF